jgi:hypothetical protein
MAANGTKKDGWEEEKFERERMKTRKQFWALFKFQAMINPFIWVMPLAFGFPVLMPLWRNNLENYHPDFFGLIFNPTLFGFAIFGAMVLAPERIFVGNASVMASYSGTEFLITRAIDRPVLYRARAAFIYLLVLMIPLVGIVHALEKPDVLVQEYSRPIQQAALSAMPGSTLLPPETKKGSSSLIAIPRGNVLAAEWQMVLPVMLIIVMQIAVLILHPFKYGRWIFWSLYVVSCFGPLLDLKSGGAKGPTVNESAFFAFAGHQALFLGLIAGMFVLTQLWCERRFAALEQ